MATTFVTSGRTVTVSADYPLPVAFYIGKSGSAAVSGSLAATGAAPVSFTPELGRPVYLTLSGTWAGTVTMQRSVDNGKTWADLKIGDKAYPALTSNGVRPVWEETESGAIIRVYATLSSGTLTYRIGQ